MRKLFIVALVLAVLGLALPAMAGGRPFTLELTGAAERPVPPGGDLDGSGTALITLNQGQGEVCFEFTVSGVETITAAHIHLAPVTEAGPVVVPFDVTSGLSGCTTVDPELIKQIRQNPGDYYVNLHNAAFPAGALRAQLSS